MTGRMIHIFNITVRDTVKDALGGAQDILAFVNMLNEDAEWEEHLDAIIDAYHAKHGRSVYHYVFLN